MEMSPLICLFRKNDPCEAIDRIAKGESTYLARFLVSFILIHCARASLHSVLLL